MLFLLFVAALFAFSPYKVLNDADTGWHIYAGKAILENMAIPKINVFSFTSGDYEWLNISWLWDVVAYLTNEFGGLYSVSAITIIIAGIIIWLISYLCIEKNGGTIATTLTILSGSSALFPTLLARPHLITILFSVILLILLDRFEKRESKPLNLFLDCLILFILWVNMHGGFIAGYTILGAYLLKFLLDKDFSKAKYIAIIGAVCLASSVINPLGLRIFEAMNRSLSSNMMGIILEWESPSEPKYFAYPIFVIAVILASIKRLKLSDSPMILLVLFWLAQGLLSIRNLPILFVVSAPVIAPMLRQSLKKLERKENEYSKDFSSRNFTKSVSLLCVFITVLFVSPLSQDLFYPKGFDVNNSNNYPYNEIEFAVENYPNERYFNHYDYGGYLIYGSKGKIKTFIDGRAETAFPSEVVSDYLEFHKNQKGWEKLLDKYQITAALMPVNLGAQLDYFTQSPNWFEAYRGNKAVLFVKR